MKPWRLGLRRILAGVALGAVLAGGAGLSAPSSGTAPGEAPVWVIPVHGTIDLGLAVYVEREAAKALEAGAQLILIELNTFGGRVDAATEIRDTLLRSPIPAAAFIGERAWSAGALIALAADWIYMAPGSSIGAAQPVPVDEKTVSALRAEFEATAERTGRDPRIAAAMVDASVAIDGLVAEGQILTLTAVRAVEVGYADGIASSREEVLAALGFAGRQTVVARLSWAERAARFLSEPTVSQLLLTLGFLGLIAEATSPGLGVPGAVGVISLLLFYGSRMIAGLVGWEAALLLLAGLVLLALEIFVIPGFGVAGLAGIGATLASLVISFGGVEEALRSVGISLALTLAGAVVIWRYGRRRGLWRRVVLETRLAGKDRTVDEGPRPAVGQQGVALTALRPSGIVEIEGERVDALSEGGYIAAGTPVEVRAVEGRRVVVREIKGG